MKILIFLFLLPIAALASPLPLSSTFELQPKDASIRWNYLPSLNSWRAETQWQNETFNMTVIHTEPIAFANSVSVNKMWSQQTQSLPQGMKVLSDKKCQKQGRVHFVCERTVNENNSFLVNERLYWNEKSDLVLVRVSTPKNREALTQFADRLPVQIVSRLPASPKKAVTK